MCDKIIQYSLFFFIFFLSFSCCTGTQKAPFFFTLLEICPACVCVCECVMVASLRFYLATDESASVATTAGATLTAISQRQLRFPLLQTTTTTTINNSSVATIAVFFLVTGFDRRVGVWSGCVSVCCCCLHSTLAHSWCHTHTFVQDAGQTYVRAHTYKQILLFSYEQGKQCVSVLFCFCMN